jgi:NAD(P)H-hydrate repair Nnr-like enzyme with NAD(P)H-hydrate dehydratase domain
MAKLQLKRATKLGLSVVDEITPCDIVVDAIFGAGLNRELDSDTIKLLQDINILDAFKIACDVPTGILEDGRVCDEVFCADVTITMGALKKSLYSDSAKDYVGEILCVDLGVSRKMYELSSDTHLLEFSDMRLPIREQKATHKGTFGHSAIFVGDKEGAGVIAGMASARFGAGLTTLITAQKLTIPHHLMQSDNLPTNTTAIAIGMGLGGYFDDEFLHKNVIDSDIPIVLDADAFYEPKLLNILSQESREIIITPHPKEFASMWQILTGEVLSIEDIQNHRFDIAKRFSQLYPSVVLLLKGANMLISYQNQIYITAYAKSYLS